MLFLDAKKVFDFLNTSQTPIIVSFVAGVYKNPTAKLATHNGAIGLLGVMVFIFHLCAEMLKNAIKNENFNEIYDIVIQIIPLIVSLIGLLCVLNRYKNKTLILMIIAIF